MGLGLGFFLYFFLMLSKLPPSIVWALSSLKTFYAPQYCLGTFNHYGFHAPQELFGHFQSLWFSCPPRVIWALSIIEDFFWHLPPSVGCDPSQGYFQKTLPDSKRDCKGYISAL
jgi:hypothetical protein